MTTVFDGKAYAQNITARLKQTISEAGLAPHLAIVMIGEDQASRIYVDKKVEAAREIGAEAEVLDFPEDVPEGEIIRHLRNLNDDKSVTGIIVQLPLPKGLKKERVLSQIERTKDVDGLTKGSQFVGATPRAVMEILTSSNQTLVGKYAVVVGSSDLVGKPVANLLLDENATVTVTNDKTKDLASFTRAADILVSCAGSGHLITAEMVKDGVMVIDVGITRQRDGKIVGDVEFEGVCSKSSFITPVPGGVGPMTVAMLLSNLVLASQK